MRSKTTTNQVDEYIDKLAPEKQLLAQEIRRIINASVAHLEECVRWDSACYFFYGPVCYFVSSRSGIHFGFFRGKELADPGRRLVSRNGQTPHVKIRSLEDIDENYFGDLVREAVLLNQN
ncbi:hypothetical protein CLV24_12359 [Pontibacter ummariensis]|uniref:YdhG-like domain-containing protein n=1 Tax=Pontibacter ummariensis TaxID=1610492 RepID=A0A239JS00_9BACT|nr:DUF1801 domain-containing protein [Pontibacter ummariensis]PRY07410.1 hypothetical protein CLV24_12359 [Pontibacter ummariensis]SNT08776.1 hypothetical protein SAMN06296052_12359 [Pontibacter ummariensis]